MFQRCSEIWAAIVKFLHTDSRSSTYFEHVWIMLWAFLWTNIREGPKISYGNQADHIYFVKTLGSWRQDSVDVAASLIWMWQDDLALCTINLMNQTQENSGFFRIEEEFSVYLMKMWYFLNSLFLCFSVLSVPGPRSRTHGWRSDTPVFVFSVRGRYFLELISIQYNNYTQHPSRKLLQLCGWRF